MKIKNDEKGAIVLEACVVIPLLMIVMTLFVYLINIFVVQGYVQYGLNQTVNELGNYIYYLNYLGIIDLSNDLHSGLGEQTEQNRKDFDTVQTAYNSVTNALTNASDTANNLKTVSEGQLDLGQLESCISGVSSTADSIQTAGNDVKSAWEMIKGYAQNPSELLSRLKSQLLLEGMDAAHGLLGGFLGKIMLNKYVKSELLEGCGVVSTGYNGSMKKGEYMAGIGGMDFSHSSFLGGEDSRQIDLIVFYRIKFPFNLSGWLGIDEGPLYDNSLLVVQRASGYGWINGDGKGKGKSEYNKSP